MSEERPNRLRELRRAADLTQEELARLAGVHPQHLGDLERGKYKPTLETAQAIALALHATVDDLFLPARSGNVPDNSQGVPASTAPSSLPAVTASDRTPAEQAAVKRGGE